MAAAGAGCRRGRSHTVCCGARMQPTRTPPPYQAFTGGCVMTDTIVNTVAPTGRLTAAARFLRARLAEASTYRGAMLIFTAAGVLIRPEVAEAVTAFGLAVAGLLGVLFPDNAQAPD